MLIEELNNKYCYFNLRQNILFKDISDASIHDLIEISEFEILPKNICILNTPQSLNRFYIIFSGKIKVYQFDHDNDRQISLCLLTNNDVFDVFSFLIGHSHNLLYKTIDNTALINIPFDKMKFWIEHNSKFLKNLFSYTLAKMQKLEDYVIDLGLENIPNRLAKLLFNNMDEMTNKIELLNDLSHEDIGQLIGTTRVILNRHIQDFKKEGIIKVTRKHIEIINLKLLKKKIVD